MQSRVLILRARTLETGRPWGCARPQPEPVLPASGSKVRLQLPSLHLLGVKCRQKGVFRHHQHALWFFSSILLPKGIIYLLTPLHKDTERDLFPSVGGAEQKCDLPNFSFSETEKSPVADHM